MGLGVLALKLAVGDAIGGLVGVEFADTRGRGGGGGAGRSGLAAAGVGWEGGAGQGRELAEDTGSLLLDGVDTKKQLLALEEEFVDPDLLVSPHGREVEELGAWSRGRGAGSDVGVVGVGLGRGLGGGLFRVVLFGGGGREVAGGGLFGGAAREGVGLGVDAGDGEGRGREGEGAGLADDLLDLGFEGGDALVGGLAFGEELVDFTRASRAWRMVSASAAEDNVAKG